MHFLSNTRLYYIKIQHLSVFQKALNSRYFATARNHRCFRYDATLRQHYSISCRNAI